MERQDLQFHREINLAHVHSRWHRQHNWCEIEDTRHSRREEPVAHSLRGGGRCTDHADGHPLQLDQGLHLVERAHHDTTDRLADPAGVDIEQCDHAEAAGLKPAVPRKGVAEVADPDQKHRTVLGQTEFSGDAAQQEIHPIADATCPVRTKMGQVLAHLRRGHAGRRSERLGRHSVHPPIGKRGKDPQVERESGDCRRRHRRAGTAGRNGPAKLGHVRLPHHFEAPGCRRRLPSASSASQSNSSASRSNDAGRRLSG